MLSVNELNIRISVYTYIRIIYHNTTYLVDIILESLIRLLGEPTHDLHLLRNCVKRCCKHKLAVGGAPLWARRSEEVRHSAMAMVPRRAQNNNESVA